MKNIFLFLFITILLFSSCVVYYPQQASIPLMEHEKEFQVEGGIGLFKPNINATVSYSPYKNLSISAYGCFDGDYTYFTQMAAGYYNKALGTVNYEIYAGYGEGTASAYNDANGGVLEGNLHMPYTQINVGYRNSNDFNFEYGLGIKSGILFSSLKDDSYYGQGIFDKSTLIKYNDKNIVFEPMAFMRIGGKKISLELKTSYSYLYKLTNVEQSFPYIPFGFSVGCHYLIK